MLKKHKSIIEIYEYTRGLWFMRAIGDELTVNKRAEKAA